LDNIKLNIFSLQILKRATILFIFAMLSSCINELNIILKDQKSSGAQADPIYLVSSLDMNQNEAGSLGLAVDWTRKIAYIGDADGKECIHVIDFSDENGPEYVFKLYDDSYTGILEAHERKLPNIGSVVNRCRNLKLIDNASKLVVSSNNGPSLLSVWDLGSNPLAYDTTPWSLIAEDTPNAYARLISDVKLSGNTLEVFLTTLEGWQHYEISDITIPGAVLNPITSLGSINTANAAAFVKETYVLTKQYSGNQNIQIWDIGSGSFIDTLIDDSGTGTNTWSTDSTSSGDKLVFGGKTLTFIDASASPGLAPSISARYSGPSGTYRSIKMIEDGSDDLLFAFSNTNYLDVWNLNNINDPYLQSRTYISKLADKGPGEGYGIEVDPVSRRALLVSTNGRVAIVDIDELETTQEQPAYIPTLTIDPPVTVILGTTVDVTLTLDKPTNVAVEVNYTTQDGTATDGVDYTGSNGTITFSPGETSKTISVPILPGGTYFKSFTFEASQPSGLTSPNLIILNESTIILIGAGTA